MQGQKESLEERKMFEDFEAKITGLVNSFKTGASNTIDSIGLKSKIDSAKKDIAKIHALYDDGVREANVRLDEVKKFINI